MPTPPFELVAREKAARAIYSPWEDHSTSQGQGTSPCTKIPGLYRVDLDRNARHRRKRLGQANAELLLYSAADTDADHVWVMLVTSSLHPARQAERIKNARERGQRLVVTGYELVRQPRHGSSAVVWMSKSKLADTG